MRVEWNEETNRFDFFDVTIEQANELAEGLRLLCEQEQMVQVMEGTPEFREIVVEQLNQIYAPIRDAMDTVPEDAETEPCQCFNCIIDNILKIRQSAPYN